MKSYPIAGALWLSALLLGGVAMATENPEYQVVKRYPDFEVRRYPPQVVAETTVEGDREEVGNQAFSTLASFIFGANRRAEKIAMTAPVTQQPLPEGPRGSPEDSQRQGAFVVQFSMPRSLELSQVPAPTDPKVHVRQLPARDVAVVRYTGRWTNGRYEAHEEALREAVAREHLQVVGAPVWARYNSPMMPFFLRHNEVMLPVGGVE